jgi:hypothetical protein
MKTKQIIVLVVAISILLCTSAIEAKNWGKEDFAKLEGDARIFYVSSIKLIVNGAQFLKSLDEELGFFLKNKNNTVPASIQMDELKKSLEERFGIVIDKTEYEKKYNERMKDGFFTPDPIVQGALFFYNWTVDNNKKNRLEINISIYKIGNKIQKNKAQVNIQLMQYDTKKGEYKALSTIKGKRESWKKQTEIYEIIKNSCILK